MEQKIYVGFSWSQSIFLFSLKLIIVSLFPYLAIHFNENPLLISILIILGALFILAVGNERIIIYNDKIVQTNDSFLSWILKSKTKPIFINEIQSAYLRPASTLSEAIVGISLMSILPKRNSGRRTFPIFFQLKNGKTVQINTNLDFGKMKRIVDIVNGLI